MFQWSQLLYELRSLFKTKNTRLDIADKNIFILQAIFFSFRQIKIQYPMNQTSNIIIIYYSTSFGICDSRRDKTKSNICLGAGDK